MGFDRQLGSLTRGTVLAVAFAVLAASPASPCAFHGYQPQPTMVERLIEADQIVLARPADADRFRFEIVQQLRGAGAVTSLPFLVDSTTRRKMYLNPSAQMLFARSADTGEWQRLAYVDAEFDPVLQHIMSSLPKWEAGHSSRAQYFAALLGHKTTKVRELALRELDLVDYASLQELDLEVDSKRLRARLDVLSEMNLRAIRILLLGFSEPDPELSTYLKHRITQDVKNDGDMLGAYALSLIALDGEAALGWLVDTHLTKRQYSYNSRSGLVQALATHFQTGDTAIRRLISQSLSARVLLDEDLAYIVALQFAAIAPESEHQNLSEGLIEDDDTLAALQLLQIN